MYVKGTRNLYQDICKIFNATNQFDQPLKTILVEQNNDYQYKQVNIRKLENIVAHTKLSIVPLFRKNKYSRRKNSKNIG